MRDRMISCSLAFFCLVLNASAVFAEEKLDSKSSHEDVMELLELTGSYELTLQAMIQVMQAGRDGYNRNYPEHKIPDEIWASVVRDATKELDKKSYFDIIVPIYEKYLTNEDIKSISSFYKSSVGRKFIRVMPDIMKDTGSAGQEWSKSALKKIIPQIEKRLKELGYPGKRSG